METAAEAAVSRGEEGALTAPSAISSLYTRLALPLLLDRAQGGL
jgi:hypothetical protein